MLDSGLCARHGVGKAEAATLKAALEIGRRLLPSEHEQRLQIKSSADATTLLMLEMSHLDQEHLRNILLGTKNRVQTITTLFSSRIELLLQAVVFTDDPAL